LQYFLLYLIRLFYFFQFVDFILSVVILMMIL
jgi:hypothetical protein